MEIYKDLQTPESQEFQKLLNLAVVQVRPGHKTDLQLELEQSQVSSHLLW